MAELCAFLCQFQQIRRADIVQAYENVQNSEKIPKSIPIFSIFVHLYSRGINFSEILRKLNFFNFFQKSVTFCTFLGSIYVEGKLFS